MKKDNYNDLVKIKKEFLDGYPKDNIKLSHLDVKKGFKIIDIFYKKPLGYNLETQVRFSLKDHVGVKKTITQDIKFQFCENDHFAKNIAKNAFSLKSKIVNSFPPKKLFVNDFEFKKTLIDILDIEYHQPLPTVKKTFAIVIARIINLNSIMKINVPLSFAFTKEEYIIQNVKKENFSFFIREQNDFQIVIKDTKYIGKYNIKIIESKIVSNIYDPKILIQIFFKLGNVSRWIKFAIENPIPKEKLEFNKKLKEMTIDPNFLISCPPIAIDKSFLIFSKDISLIALDYFPPTSIQAYETKVICLFKYKNNAFKKEFQLKFKKSIKDRAYEIQNEIQPKQIKYLKSEIIKYPPSQYSADDFEIPNKLVKIKKVNCDFDKIKSNEYTVGVKIIADFRGAEIIWYKKINYEMSRTDVMASSFLYKEFDKRSISFSNEIKNPDILYEWFKKDGLVPKEIINKFIVGKNYHFQISEVKIKDFSIYSRKFKIILSISQNIKNNIVENSITHPIILNESYVEKNLQNVTPDRIKINKTLLPDYPPIEFKSGFFISDHQFNILGINYLKPSYNSKIAHIEFKISAGQKIRFIEKKLEFKMSHKEYNDNLIYSQEKKYLDSIDPSIINLHINILGAPPEDIKPENVSGVPKDIRFKIDYFKPNFGQKMGLFKITLFKNKAHVSFVQKIFFNLPRTKESKRLHKNYLNNINSFKLKKFYNKIKNPNNY